MGKDLEKLRKEWLSYHKANKELSHAEEAFLSHHGILGMKWGIRRFQNKDGTRTPAGKKRYQNSEAKNQKSSSSNNAVWDEDVEKAYQYMRNHSKTDEEKDRKVRSWERARDEDLWDLDFLEAVQNSKALHTGDTKTLLAEYAYFLDDPTDYWMNRSSRLEQE